VVKRLVRGWLARRGDDALLRDSVGKSPSIADIVRMVHPRPATAAREALYGYLIGKEVDEEALPRLVRDLETFRRELNGHPVPDVPFQMLTSLPLDRSHWIEIARRAPWQMTRMNLSTFARHGVLDSEEMVEMIAERIRNPELISRARVFPYQLMVAYTSAQAEIPKAIRDALHDAMEVAIGNVPVIDGQIYVCPDVSGSMAWASATGYRKGSTSVVRCIDVAALVTAALVRKNPSAGVLPFERGVVKLELDARDPVMTNAARLASVGGGGTSCSAPLRLLNRRRARGDLVILVSDNESWADARPGRGAAMMHEWAAFVSRNPGARLVCLDIQPNRTTQAAERNDILNIGGFSDQVFSLIAAFARGELRPDHWIGVIDAIEL
jgi:60 kDa SS-A/Ro ribonucleoprotein